MSQESIASTTPVLQLDFFVSQSPAYQEALDRYEKIRPVLKEDRTLSQQFTTGHFYGEFRSKEKATGIGFTSFKK